MNEYICAGTRYMANGVEYVHIETAILSLVLTGF